MRIGLPRKDDGTDGCKYSSCLTPGKTSQAGARQDVREWRKCGCHAVRNSGENSEKLVRHSEGET